MLSFEMFSVVINMSWHFLVCCLLLCVFFLKDGTNYFSYEMNLALRTVAIIFAVITNLASVGSKIAIEKDWVVVIAKNDIEKLTSMNSIFRTIDLVSFRALVAIPRILFIFFALFGGDPKTKFLRLFLSDSALRPPTWKKLLLTLPFFDLRPLTWGQSYKDFYWGQTYTYFYTLGQIYKHVLMLSIDYSCHP